MDERTRLILLGGVALLVLAIISGVVFFVLRASQGGTNEPTDSSTDLSLRLPTITPTITPSVGRLTPGQAKTYTGSGFTVDYPTSWGVLACANSQNFELDPTNSQEIRGVVCSEAVKPVTVLVTGGLSCQGESVRIGNSQVVRSKAGASGEINYRWCVQLPDGRSLDITHRVSQTGSRATSKEDFSAAVEQVISTVSVTPPGGS